MGSETVLVDHARNGTATSDSISSIVRTTSIYRSATTLLVAVALLFALPGSSARAQTSDEAAAQAAREIQVARDRANRAAQAGVDAETKLDELNVEEGRLQAEADVLRAKVDGLRAGVQDLALDRYIRGDVGAAGLFIGLEGPTQRIEADILSRLAVDASSTSIDQFESAQNDLSKKEAQLKRTKKETEQAKATLKKMEENALAEVERRKQIESKRLKDEAVRRALEAQLAEQRRREQEKQERFAKAAAEQAAADQAADEQRRSAAAAQSPAPGGGSSPVPAPSGGSSSSSGSGGSSADPGSSGDSSGGSSGGGAGTTGGGGDPGQGGGGDTGGAYVDFDIVCPIAASAYGDTWGAPRSGGRRHQGVDMLASTGTLLFAVVGGSVRFSSNSLGGNAVWLTGNIGNSYYYAHLDSYEGDSRGVSQGEVIGYVGDTGNARGTPHLHFEVHPGGGPAVNPTPSVRAAGC